METNGCCFSFFNWGGKNKVGEYKELSEDISQKNTKSVRPRSASKIQGG